MASHVEGKSFGRSISKVGLYHVYDRYKEVVFPRLLENPNVSPEDKLKIRALLRKPWNPYVVDGHLIAICQNDILIYLEMPHVKRSWKSNLENEKGRNILFPSNTNY